MADVEQAAEQQLPGVLYVGVTRTRLQTPVDAEKGQRMRDGFVHEGDTVYHLCLYLASRENRTGTSTWALFSFFLCCSISRIRVTLCQGTAAASGPGSLLSCGFLVGRNTRHDIGAVS